MNPHFFTAPFLLAAKLHRHFSFHPPPEHAGKLCHVERLGDVLIHAGILGTDDVFGEGIRRHGEDRKCFGIPLGKAADRSGGFIAIHDRHLDIHEDELVVARWMGGDLVNAVLSIHCRLDIGACHFEELLRDFTVQGIILDDKDAPAGQSQAAERQDTCLFRYLAFPFGARLQCSEETGAEEGLRDEVIGPCLAGFCFDRRIVIRRLYDDGDACADDLPKPPDGLYTAHSGHFPVDDDGVIVFMRCGRASAFAIASSPEVAASP